ncbi:LysR family transcriptional regulator [Niallia sp. NCCP-28]|uniref:LysR family transcriptional regulator n=1 Tax=Niallia sp. NCCP-28 TaxID=2934712 RepID=UPI00208995E8|nr:LysR family transcriptional regulator [Niallia sp. NCCP-28]GKU83265.1 LysR family transcriptional regulator [Niallia sp. NCCP-28]
MNLRHLHYFRVLAKREHYTQAAEELSIAQPSLSHAISELEKELGTFLFEKQGRNIRLTKYGRFFLDYVNSGLEQLEIGEKKLKQILSPTEGQIDVAFIYTLGANFVPNLLKAFTSKKDYEKFSFNLHQSTTKNILTLLKDQKTDLAFCSYVENEPDIEFIPIVQEELVLVVSNDHALADFDTINLKDTQNYPFIFFSKSSGIRPFIEKMFKKIDIHPNIICEVEEDHAMAGLVSINYGIAIMPKLKALQHYNVKVISIAEPLVQRFIYIASLKNHYLSPATQSFRNFTINYCNDFYLKYSKLI